MISGEGKLNFCHAMVGLRTGEKGGVFSTFLFIKLLFDPKIHVLEKMF